MSDGTKIEWTDATWNPVTGCSVVSPGCTNCYAMKLAGTRLQHHPSRAGLTRETKAGPVWNGTVRFNEEWLIQPLRWKRPRMVFVCAHGDLFHEDVPDEWIDKVFAVMALAPQHTFQVLTKRAARMRGYVEAVIQSGRWLLWTHPEHGHPIFDYAAQWHVMLRHVWLGVSAEDQTRADERVPELLATPAAIRFVSAEPLLGPIDFTRLKLTATDAAGNSINIIDPLDAFTGMTWATLRSGARAGQRLYSGHSGGRGKLDWVIVGGENGPREMRAEWAQQIRDQCDAAGTAFYFKQWGSHIPAGQTMANGKVWAPGCGTRLRATKGITGRLLDGVEHNAMPRAA